MKKLPRRAGAFSAPKVRWPERLRHAVIADVWIGADDLDQDSFPTNTLRSLSPRSLTVGSGPGCSIERGKGPVWRP
jgi:hypothetical protein